MAHTPGPWRADQEGGWVVLNGSHAYAVRDICSDDRGWNADDLRLIAAAPDLLAALRLVRDELIDQYEENCPDDESDNDITAAIDAAIAAIAKAEGRET